MKKKHYFLGSTILLLLIFIAVFIYRHQLNPVVPKSTKLISLTTAPACTLIYGDINLSTVKSFTINEGGLQPNAESYSCYSEGFLPQAQFNKLLEAINTTREKDGLIPLHSFYQYHELGGYGMVSLSDGLDYLYLVDLTSYEVHTPKFVPEEGKLRQYVYHIAEAPTGYYILTGQANSYNAHLYHLDRQELSLQHLLCYETDPLAISSSHYALDHQGKAYFASEQGIDIVESTYSTQLPLDFTPEKLLYSQNMLFALGHKKDKLYYKVFDTTQPPLAVIDEGTLTLPNTELTFMYAKLQGDQLYVLTFDQAHPLYRNYLTVYSLKTKSLDYCLALQSFQDLALLALK